MVAIWALKYFELRGKGPITDESVVRSRMLLERINEDQDQLFFSSIAVAEYLVPFPTKDHGIQISKLQSLFFCPAFDIHAASIAADLFQRYRKLPKGQQTATRTQLKADIQIVATARAANVQRFYSHDAACRKVASLVMRAEDLPTTTGNFLTDKDIRDGAV